MIAKADAVFASDVHLSADHPETTAHFLRFIDDQVDGRTARFYLLGDLFEYWSGDEDLDDPLASVIAARLHALGERSVEVFFMAGNRDFLVGDRFAAAAGLVILADPCRVRIGGVDLLLSHGDALCVDDVDYQRFRAMVREPGWQADFLAKPHASRRAIVAGVRMQSQAAKQQKAAAIMDVNEGAVDALLAAYPGTVLIHGHTHRPAHHVQTGGRERWVLTDWDGERGGGLALRDGELGRLG